MILRDRHVDPDRHASERVDDRQREEIPCNPLHFSTPFCLGSEAVSIAAALKPGLFDGSFLSRFVSAVCRRQTTEDTHPPGRWCRGLRRRPILKLARLLAQLEFLDLACR